MEKRRGTGKNSWPPPVDSDRALNVIQNAARFGYRAFMLALGPILLGLAAYLISFVLYVGTTSVLPLYGGRFNPVFIFFYSLYYIFGF